MCLILPGLLSAPGGPHLSLSYCLFLGQSLSLHPIAGRGQAANQQRSVLVQQRPSPAQRVPSAVGDTECRRHWRSLVCSPSKQWDSWNSWREATNMRRFSSKHEVYVIVSGGDPGTLKFLLSFHTGSIFLEHHFYLIRKQVPLKCPPKLSRCSGRDSDETMTITTVIRKLM